MENKINENGYTSMTFVMKKNDYDMAYEMLNDKDVDSNKMDAHGNTPFILACQENPYFAVEMLQHDDINFDTVKGQDNTVSKQIGNPYEGKTGFHCAVIDQPELAIALMDYDGFDISDKLDINKPDNDGNTPFMTACENTKNGFAYEMLSYEMLKRDDIDFNAQNKKGNTACIKASKEAYLNSIGNNNAYQEYTDLLSSMQQSGKIDFTIENNANKNVESYLSRSDHLKEQPVYKAIKDEKENKELKQNIKQPEQHKISKNKML